MAVFIISACDRWLRGGWVMQADSVNRFAIRGAAVFAIDSSVLAAALVSNCEHRTICCGLWATIDSSMSRRSSVCARAGI